MERTIRFDHFIEFPKDDCLFAAGYEEGSGKIRLFLVFKTGSVYTLQQNSWQPVSETEEDAVRVVSAPANRGKSRSFISQEPIHFNLPQYFCAVHNTPIQLN